MKTPYNAFEKFRKKIDGLQELISKETSTPECLESANPPLSEVASALEIRHTADTKLLYFKKVKECCDEFLRHAVPEGSSEESERFKVSHYTRKVFDKKSWERFAKTNSELAPLWISAQALEQRKRELKAQFEHLDSSIRVTPKKEIF